MKIQRYKYEKDKYHHCHCYIDKTNDGDLYYCAAVDPVIAKLEAENEKLREIAYDLWCYRFSQIKNSISKREFEIVLERKLKEE